ncbi:MAG TPA: sigma-70 family RNA polymerase sigma factor [Chitinophagaceae bacterium]|nr:sigma-70 family RNA polymerase sigma factor [Chitinophagaceae bacterium]
MATDKETFVKRIQENKKIIFKICNSYCSNKHDRDDLAQEIVFNLWKSFAGFTPNYKFSTWMYRIALNVAISFYRKEMRVIQFDAYSEDLIVFAEDSDEKIEIEKNLSLLQKFILELNEIDKSIMLLYLDDKSHKEIAEITGISESNVATKINRIKNRLKSKFSNN